MSVNLFCFYSTDAANVMSQSDEEALSQSILAMPQMQEQDYSPISKPTDASRDSTQGSSEEIIYPSPVPQSKSRLPKFSEAIKTSERRVSLFSKNLAPEDPERSDQIGNAVDRFGINSEASFKW